MATKTWELILKRRSKNSLNPDKTKFKIKDIVKLIDKFAGQGFTYSVPLRLPEPIRVKDEDGRPMYEYTIPIVVSKEGGSDLDDDIITSIKQLVRKKAIVSEWVLIADGIEFGEAERALRVRPAFNMPTLTEHAIKTYFRGIYERDAHIRLIYDGIRSFVESGGKSKGHTLLYGRPAGCKTTLYECYKRFLEKDSAGYERMIFLDAPLLTKAGLENWIVTRAEDNELPEILVIEEIEKQNLDNILSLLSIMGSGHIIKTNARVGRKELMVKAMVFATCNDEQKLKEFREGAIWSRFAHKWFCPLPDEKLMMKILRDKVQERIDDGKEGDLRWAEKAHEFAYITHAQHFQFAMHDPREIVGLLDGGNRLLTGEYQRDVLSIMKRKKKEDEERAAAAAKATEAHV